MFGIGGFELFIILIFGFLIFGPDKLPEIAKTVGRGIAKFREAQQEVNDAIGDEKLVDLNNPDEPFKDPVEVLDRIAQRHEEGKGAKTSQAAAKAKAAKPVAPEKAEASAGAGEGAVASPAEGEAEQAPRAESFTERKARYERERAARKAAEAETAKNPDKAAAEAVDAAQSPAPAAEAASESEAAAGDNAVPVNAGGDE